MLWCLGKAPQAQTDASCFKEGSLEALLTLTVWVTLPLCLGTAVLCPLALKGLPASFFQNLRDLICCALLPRRDVAADRVQPFKSLWPLALERKLMEN